MLVEFSVGNYRSFYEIVTFSMVAAKLRSKTKELDENNVYQITGHPDLLISAAIYGANASGKSNLVAAMHFMRKFVLDSPKETRATGAIPTEHFRLRTETENQPSHFEIVFISEGKRYRYGFEITKERVIGEWLYYVPRSREARLFERNLDEVVLGEHFKEGRDLIELTRPNALFLSVVAQFNGEIAQGIVSWFRKLQIASGLQDVGMRMFTIAGFLERGLDQEIVNLIKAVDLGIDNVIVEKNIPAKPLPEGLPENVKSALQTLLDDQEGARIGVNTVHVKFNAAGERVATEIFDLDEQESAGTQKLFALAGPLVETLREGQILVIDELDARLHPLMTCEIIRLFNHKETNPHHAQLIFTTHDTNLLGNDLFRRDQIWFVEKDRTGATDLYSLAEFKVRNDASYERDYIKGRYGAIPMLGNVHPIGEKH